MSPHNLIVGYSGPANVSGHITFVNNGRLMSNVFNGRLSSPRAPPMVFLNFGAYEWCHRLLGFLSVIVVNICQLLTYVPIK